METVHDLTETDIISVLHKVTIAHLERSKSTSPLDVDVMQVDHASVRTQDILSLEEFLGRCVSYDTSASALRLALRKNLSDAEEIVAVLQVLGSWMKKWGEAEDEVGVFAVYSSSSKDDPTRQLPEPSKVSASIGNMKICLMVPFNRLYRSSKRS